MKYFKENIVDIVILVLLTVWGVYEISMISFFHDSIVTIFMCLCLIFLFPFAYQKTNIQDMKARYTAFQFAFILIIISFCLLKIGEVLFEKTLEIDGIKIIFIGIYIESIYYMLTKKKYRMALQ